MVAADIITGQEVIFRRGLLWQAVLASMAIPGVYPAQCIGGQQLVDGGVLNPVPGDVVANMGADIVIAVKLATRSAPPPVDAEAVEAMGRPPTVLQVITRSIDLLQSKIAAESGSAATILLEPDFTNAGSFGLRSFTQGRRFIPLGEAVAEAALPRIAAALPWVDL
jgi:NTE family protein